jgi:hypothetical protein
MPPSSAVGGDGRATSPRAGTAPSKETATKTAAAILKENNLKISGFAKNENTINPTFPYCSAYLNVLLLELSRRSLSHKTPENPRNQETTYSKMWQVLLKYGPERRKNLILRIKKCV